MTVSRPDRPNQPRQTSNSAAVIVYMIGILIVAGFLYHVTVADYRALAAHGVSATGTVTTLERRNHARVSATFVVDTVTYEITLGHSARFGNPAFNDLSVGDAVLVTYLPSDPSQSCLGSADARLHDALRDTVLIALLAPAVLVFVVWRGYHREACPAELGDSQ